MTGIFFYISSIMSKLCFFRTFTFLAAEFLHMNQPYLFTSQRLGFRNWIESDIPKMAAVSADPIVMEFFPAVQNMKQTTAFVERMQKIFKEKSHCFFPTERLDDGQFIGFIGIGYSTFESNFTPAPDIGWRLSKEFWGNGYATEGAKSCLKYAFEELKLPNIISVASIVNVPSINVMKKIGMKKVGEFVHPKLLEFPKIKDCVCYSITKPNYRS